MSKLVYRSPCGLGFVIAACLAIIALPKGAFAEQLPAESMESLVRQLDEQQAELGRLRREMSDMQQRFQPYPPMPPADDFDADSAQTIMRLPNVEETPEIVFQLQQKVTALERQLQQQAQEIQRLPETALSPVAPPAKPDDLAMFGKWNNMAEFKSKDGNFRSHIGGCVQFDITGFDNDSALVVPQAVGGIGPQPNSLTLRRARFRADGTVYGNIDYAAEVELANDLTSTTASPGQPVAINPAITDFWITWTQIPCLGNVRVGNQKEPMGMEHMMSYKFTDFMERSYLQDIVFGPFTNGFSPGITAFNWADDELATWALGWYGNSSDVFGYSLGNDYAMTGRLTCLPYYDEQSDGRYLWHVGASGSLRGPDEGLVRLRTRGNVRSGPPGTLNPIYADTRNMEADAENIAAAETAVQWGPWSVQAEYVAVWVPGAVQPFPPAVPVARGTPFFQGGYVEVLWFITGEHRNYNRKLGALDRPMVYTPVQSIKSCGEYCLSGCGAWQLGCRYSAMDLNDNGINGGNLQSMTWGLNWFLNPNTKVQFNYDLTHRSEVLTVAAGTIHSFGTRFSVDF
jgi:phosphate-selective porin OprO/OprP